MPTASVLCGSNGALGKIGSTSALPPASAAGFVHRTDSPGTVVRPNRLSDGTG